jgi:hypothetical protein
MTHNQILLFHLRLPLPRGPGPRIYIRQEPCGPVITPQGYGGGILTRLHTRSLLAKMDSFFYSLCVSLSVVYFLYFTEY